MTRVPARIVLLLALAGCGPKTPPEPAAQPEPAPAPTAESPDGAGTSTPAPASGEGKKPIEVRVAKAIELLESGVPENVAKAIQRFTNMSQEAPDSPVIRFNLGVAQELMGDETEARKSYLRATDIDPTYGNAWYNLGAMAERDGDLSRALQSYRAGLRNAPAHPELTAAVINVLRKQGKLDEAVREAKAAIKQDANNVEAYNALGLVYLEQDKLELAQFIYQRVLQAFPDKADKNAYVHANLGRVYFAQGRVPEAEKKFQDALLRDNKLVAAMMYLSLLYIDNRNWDATVGSLEYARELEPENAAIRVNLGIGLRGQGKYEDALAQYDKALDLDPELVDVHLNRALVYGLNLQEFDKAYAALDRYSDLGGTETELAEQWRGEFEKTQKKLERDAARKKKREEQRKRREEEKRLLEEERKAEEAAAAKAAEEAAAKEAAAKEAAEQAAQDGAEQSAPEGAPPPAGEAAGGGSNAAGVGQACTGFGTCGDPSLECAQDNVCREVGSPGTFGAGVGCVQDADCASGLSCVNNACGAGGGDAAGGGSPWGG